MPEMPEVESIVVGIRDKICNRVITDIEVKKADVIKYPTKDVYVKLLLNQRIEAINRRGKYIIMYLESGVLHVIHLRMTGKLLFVPNGEAIDKYACVIFSLDSGDKLVYADVRRLGTLDVVTKAELPQRLKGLYNLGAEPLSAEFTTAYLTEILQKNHGKIKPFLLNQNHIAGLGNIYVDEALAISKIHPERTADSLNTAEINSLYEAINRVISAGIQDGGTTFRDYRNGLGKKGSHQEHLYVYNRQGKPCRFCQTPIEKIVVNGRGTYYCPSCQQKKRK